MDIVILLKANIRHKKGAFISIVLLMLLIAMALTTIFSLKDNCKSSLEEAMEFADLGNLCVFVREENFTEELVTSLQDHELVRKVADYPALVANRQKVNGNEITNSWMMQKLRPGFRLFNHNLTAYESETPALGKGEIYIPQGVCTNMECGVGDRIQIETISGSYQFIVKGVIVEPFNGSSQIGWKQVFISDEDFDRIINDGKKNETYKKTLAVHGVQIYKSEGCALSDGKFRRQLNLDTGIVDSASGSLTKELSIHYTNLFPDIILSILTVFIGCLAVAMLIVMGHSISTGIEMDYVNLGILKSQGFTKGKIRTVFVLQYLLAQIFGGVLGMIFAIPLTRAFGNVFQPITAVLIENHISAGKSILTMFAILMISGLFICLITRKIGRISPVRALAGGREEIYFDSRWKVPISKKILSPSLAFRQFISNKRQYAGIILVVSILVFFMMTVMILGNVVNSKTALESMGLIYRDLDISFTESTDEEIFQEIEHTIQEYSGIEEKYYCDSIYFSINGEEILCTIYRDPQNIKIEKGRVPLYENEIVITDIVAEELELEMGDRVTVSSNNIKSEYIISGFYQTTSDTGMSFAMTLEGAGRIGIEQVYYGMFVLETPEKSKQVVSVLNEKYGKFLKAEALTDENGENDIEGMEVIIIAINAMKAVIYIFSAIFALIVVHMVCSKAFLREKTDIGIYKALGFTSRSLRIQFAVRFLIIAILGAAIGTLLSILCSGKMLSQLLRGIGISNLTVQFTLSTFVIPIVGICTCFFLFSYLIARKIRRVPVRELVAET